MLTAWLGEIAALPARRLFAANKIPTYETPDDAVTAFLHLCAYGRNQELLLETPLARPGTDAPDREVARKLVAEVLAIGRPLLTEPESKSVLQAYAIPTVDTRTARDPAEAARIAAEIGGRVAIKILSPDIVHKSDVGGVRLDLSGAEVESAAREMLDKVNGRAPQARLAGFSVEEMISRPQAFELLAGIADDPVFGPVILFGQGGTAAEIIRDRAIGLPPLNLPLAREMIGRTRVASLLEGYRDRPAAAIDEVALTLVKLSQLLIDVPEITELDINPLIADSEGVLALDARIVVHSSAAADRLAIRPYPSEFEETIALADGSTVFVRPIRPEDQPKLVAMVMESTPRDIYLRFLPDEAVSPLDGGATVTDRLQPRDGLRRHSPAGQRRCWRYPRGRAHDRRSEQRARRVRRHGSFRLARSRPRLQADADADHLRRSPRHRHALRRCAPRKHHHAADGPRARLQGRDNRYAPIVLRRAKPPRGRSSAVVSQYGERCLWFESISLHHPVAPNWRNFLASGICRARR